MPNRNPKKEISPQSVSQPNHDEEREDRVLCQRADNGAVHAMTPSGLSGNQRCELMRTATKRRKDRVAEPSAIGAPVCMIPPLVRRFQFLLDGPEDPLQ